MKAPRCVFLVLLVRLERALPQGYNLIPALFPQIEPYTFVFKAPGIQ